MEDAKNNFVVHVLFRFSKRTGKVDTTMTAMGSALLRFWAMNNTTPSKETLVLNRVTGAVVLHVVGQRDGYPQLFSNCGTCEDFNISLEELQSIKDERFDKED